MTIYLAGAWKRRDETRIIRDRFVAEGFDVNSRWLDVKVTGAPTPEVMLNEAINDWADLIEADVLVVNNSEYSEGKAVETGIALAMGHRIIVIGATRSEPPYHDGKSNVFQYLPHVEMVGSVDEAIAKLRAS